MGQREIEQCGVERDLQGRQKVRSALLDFRGHESHLSGND